MIASAGPSSGSLLSVIGGKTTSIQTGFEFTRWKKLHSFLVAAEAACSIGDLPVVAEEVRLAAVIGFATAAVVIAEPAELAAAVPELPNAARGATQPVSDKRDAQTSDQARAPDLIRKIPYFFLQTVLNTPAVQESF